MPTRTAIRIPALVKRLQLAFRAALDEALRVHGISASQYGVLRRLHDDPRLSNAALARAMGVTPQAMQELISGLESSGLVSRSADPGHGRIRPAELTPAGLDLVTACRKVADSVEARMLAPLDRAERAMFADYLERCVEALQ